MADTNFHIHAHRCGVVLNGFLFAGNSFLKTSLCVISRVCPFFLFFTINPRGPFNPISQTLSLTNEILLLNCCSLTRILSYPLSYTSRRVYLYNNYSIVVIIDTESVTVYMNVRSVDKNNENYYTVSNIIYCTILYNKGVRMSHGRLL